MKKSINNIDSLRGKYERIQSKIVPKPEEHIDPTCLLTFAYEYVGQDSEISIETEEFTAICPWTGMPATRDDPNSPIEIANTLSNIFIMDRQSTRLAEISKLETMANAQGTTNTEAIVQAQLSTLGSITVVEAAQVSVSAVTPSLALNLTLAGFLGLLLGTLLTFFLDYTSSKLKSLDQIDKIIQTGNITGSLLGIIFKWSSKDVTENSVVLTDDPTSVWAEMYRQIRTGFQFANTSLSGKTFLVTSVGPQEGKSTTITNLATALVQGDHRVIIADLDLRKPTIHRYFAQDRKRIGLSTVASNNTSVLDALHETNTDGLKVLLSGPIPDNPGDILHSSKMDTILGELETHCDYLLLDSPPIMAASDTMTLASKVDGIILVVNIGSTHTESFREVINMIQRSGTPLLGYICNKVKVSAMGYGGHNYRYNYYRYYRTEHEDEKEGLGTIATNGSDVAQNQEKVLLSKIQNRFATLLGRKPRAL